ncbi:MAG: hypothetical protein U1E39_13835 [Planctomycetota bacterium]
MSTGVDLVKLRYPESRAYLDLSRLCDLSPVPLSAPPDPTVDGDIGTVEYPIFADAARHPTGFDYEAIEAAVLKQNREYLRAVKSRKAGQGLESVQLAASLVNPGPDHPRAVLIVDLSAPIKDIEADIMFLRSRLKIRGRKHGAKWGTAEWSQAFLAYAQSVRRVRKTDIARDVLGRPNEAAHVAEADVRRVVGRARKLLAEVMEIVRPKARFFRKSARRPGSRLFFATRARIGRPEPEK